MQITQGKWNGWLSVTLLAIATLGRLVPHPPNFTPIGAIALYGGARFSKTHAIVLVLATMLLSDWLLAELTGASSSGAVSLAVYLSLAAVVFVGRWFQARPGRSRFVIAILGTSTLFFLTTNLAVWLFETLYPKTLDGLLACYVAAIPFYRNQMFGDFAWGGSLFFAEFLATRLARRLVHCSPNSLES
jgi:hypothetical protein